MSDEYAHWGNPGHVTIDARGDLAAWRDHPGCRYCEVLSGRMAKRAATSPERHLGATHSSSGTTGRENGEQGDEK